MNDNPVVVQAASVTGFIVAVKALIAYFRAMGWIDLDEDRFKATEVFLDTIIPIAAVWLAAWWTRKRVTALTNPRDVDGIPLSRPQDQLPIMQMEKLEEEAQKMDERRIVR